MQRRARSISRPQCLNRIDTSILVEDFRPGYPRFSALLGANAPFNVCRRFATLRARLLLMKQDKLSLLEQELDQVDKDETRQLFLGSCRRDQNSRRKQVMQELDGALADYGMRSHRVYN